MLNETLEVAAQSTDEVNMRDFTSTPKSCNETPAISEGLELFFVMTARLKESFRARRIPALGANIRVVVISDAREDVVSGAVLGVEVDRPILSGSSFEPAKECVSVVLLLNCARRCEPPAASTTRWSRD